VLLDQRCPAFDSGNLQALVLALETQMEMLTSPSRSGVVSRASLLVVGEATDAVKAMH